MTKTAVIVASGRTAIGAFNQSLAGLSAVDIGVQLLQGLLARNPQINSNDIDQVILGQVLTAACGQNPARQTSIRSHVSPSVPAYTINQVCGSGLQSVVLAAQAIRCGDARLIVAGGQESMSQAPHVLPNSRTGKRLGDWSALDSLMEDGLQCAFGDYPMGITAENVAQQYGITRADQDAYALRSQTLAAQSNFGDEIIPVSIPQKRGDDLLFDCDEQPRASTIEGLSKLKPVFKADGSVTVGNASTINDGAAMIIVAEKEYALHHGLTILAEIKASGSAGVEPEIMGVGPVPAIKNCLNNANWQLNDVQLVELNEAFAVQVLAVMRSLELPQNIVNVRGGAIALGHPIGASGARILVSLLAEMQHRQLHRGLASLCVGGGMGVALALERPVLES